MKHISVLAWELLTGAHAKYGGLNMMMCGERLYIEDNRPSVDYVDLGTVHLFMKQREKEPNLYPPDYDCMGCRVAGDAVMEDPEWKPSRLR